MNLTFFSALPRRVLVQCGLAFWAAAAAASTVAPAAPKPAEWRILVLGDSQAQGLAAGLMRLYVRQPSVRVLDRSKIGTGLAAHNTFDWPQGAKKLAQDEHADVAVVMFGANDRPPVRLHGKVDPKLAANFAKPYGDKVTSIVNSLRGAKWPVVWVGHPQVRDPVFNQDMQMLDGIFADNATKAGARFVPTWTMFAGSDGGYDAYGKGIDGETQRLRADDGVHLTRAGYDVLAKALADQVGPASVAKK